MVDFLEGASMSAQIFHKQEGNTHHYYAYGWYTADWIVLLLYKTTYQYKRYITTKNREILESNEPKTDYFSITEVKRDEILNP